MKARSNYLGYLVFTFILVMTIVLGSSTATLAGTLTPNAPPMPDEFAISGSTSFDADVAYDSTHDEYMVVWSYNYNLLIRRVTSRGEPLGSEMFIAFHSDREFEPAISYDATNDRYLVVWKREVLFNDYIYGRFIPRTGPDSNLAEFAISTSTSGSDSPDVAYALAQGEFLVVWHNFPIIGHHTIHGRRVKADGSGFPAPDFSVASDSSQDRHYPDLTYNLARNEYMVTYDNDDDIFGTIMTGDGTKLHGGEFTIAGWPDNEIKPAVAACNLADQYLVAWISLQTSPPKLYGRYISGDSTLSTNIHMLDDLTPSFPFGEIDIACKWGLWYLMTWEHTYSNISGIGIWGRLLFSNESMDQKFEIVAPDSTNREAPAVAGGDPNYLVTWSHYEGFPASPHIYGRIVGETKPKPDFTFSPSSGTTNTVFNFDASGSSDIEDAAADLQVCWDWNNDGACDTTWTTTKTENHTFSTDGTKTVQLLVKDTYGLIASTTKQVGVGNTPPTAAFTVNPHIGDSSTNFVFDPTISTDKEDPTSSLQVRWDWENDGNWDTLWGAMQTSGVTFGAASYGQQTIVLEVEDTKGLRDSTTDIIFIDTKPTAAFTVTPPNGDTNTVFSFDASSSTDPNIGIYWLDARWDWENDGTYDTSWNSILTLVTHSYSQAGTYTVRMELQPSIGGLTDTTTRQVTVTKATFIPLYLPLVSRWVP